MSRIKIKQYSRELFFFFSFSLIIFFLLEIFFPGLVLAYFNFNLLWLVWLINLIIFFFL